MNRNQGDYIELARLAKEAREQSEYVEELRAVVAHCHAVQRLMKDVPLADLSPRQKIWSHIFDASYLALRELKRLGVEI